MGVLNEQSLNQHHQFAKGIQGAPGVGFNLTADGNYDMVSKKLTNVGDGVDPNDAVARIVCTESILKNFMTLVMQQIII